MVSNYCKGNRGSATADAEWRIAVGVRVEEPHCKRPPRACWRLLQIPRLFNVRSLPRHFPNTSTIFHALCVFRAGPEFIFLMSPAISKSDEVKGGCPAYLMFTVSDTLPQHFSVDDAVGVQIDGSPL